jgi:hypothetical protein
VLLSNINTKIVSFTIIINASDKYHAETARDTKLDNLLLSRLPGQDSSAAFSTPTQNLTIRLSHSIIFN